MVVYISVLSRVHIIASNFILNLEDDNEEYTRVKPRLCHIFQSYYISGYSPEPGLKHSEKNATHSMNVPNLLDD